MRTRLCGTLRLADVGAMVTVCGWVAKRREHGEHLAFLDLRDHTGIVQCVVPGTVDVRSEYVVAVGGVVRPRPEGTVNPDLPTGEVELGDCTVTVLNAAEPPPFAVDDRVEVDEVIRLKHRFVDLRRPRMQSNLRLRAVVNRALRAAMDRQGFVEVETPLLWAPTPEGAREFTVPEPARPRLMLRPAPEPPAGQAAADGGRCRPLLPDRPVPAGRGPAGRPAVRVLPAGRGGILRRPGGRAGVRVRGRARRRRGGHRRAARGHPQDDLGRGHRPLRLGQARHPIRHGAGRPVPGVRGHRRQGVRGAVREGHRDPRGRGLHPVASWTR